MGQRQAYSCSERRPRQREICFSGGRERRKVQFALSPNHPSVTEGERLGARSRCTSAILRQSLSAGSLGAVNRSLLISLIQHLVCSTIVSRHGLRQSKKPCERDAIRGLLRASLQSGQIGAGRFVKAGFRSPAQRCRDPSFLAQVCCRFIWLLNPFGGNVTFRNLFQRCCFSQKTLRLL